MKNLNKLLLLGIITLVITSCKKSETLFTSSANIVVANMVVGGATLTLNTTTPTVGNNASAIYPLFTGSGPINLYVAATAAAPAVTYYNQPLTVANADSYSLFLGGASPATVDAIVIKESYSNYADSLCGVRFVNLSPNSNPISVNITGQANGSEVTSLAYKAYSNFKQYPALKTNTSYAFQIKDAATGNLISSYTLTTPRFHNVTIALRGLVGGSPAVGVTLVTHP